MVNKIFYWSSQTFALIPGVAIMLDTLYSPPEINHKLVGGLVEACGCITLVLLSLGKKNILILTTTKRRNRIVLYFSLFLLFFLGYVALYLNQVSYENIYCKCDVLYPLVYGDELKHMVNKYGSMQNTIKQLGLQAIKDAIEIDKGYLTATKIIFIVTYTLIFEFITISFGIAGQIKMQPAI